MLIQRRAVPDTPALQGLAPLLIKLYAARHIRDASEVSLETAALLPPSKLKGVTEAVDLLLQMLRVQGRILIVSDFDADGATSCALAIRALRSMGFNALDYIVPDRFAYGYGLSPAIVAMARERDPALIITVDNGISSHEGVQAARDAGIKVLITDHHLPGAQLPAADAIVNPNQPGCMFPDKALAGVGVVFYLMLALRARLRELNWFTAQQIAEPRLAELLDLVALGTVADLVPLTHNNRILVSEGLRRLRQGRACPGILSLLEVGKRSLNALVASDLGFAVGPRLNAAGRLEDMSLGIACLLTDDADNARQLALKLDSINEERKRIESDMKTQAMQALTEMENNLLQSDEGGLPAGLCLYNGDWHQGVIGIVAARVKEKYHRPVIVFADAGVNERGLPEVKGSARSVGGLHIRDLLDEIASQNPGLISKFGGHAMAAGLSLDKSNLERFCHVYETACARHLDQNALQKRLLTDGELAAAEMQLETAELIRAAGPWGQGFPEPVFDGVFECLAQRRLGDKHLKFVLSPAEHLADSTAAGVAANSNRSGRLTFDGIAFNVPPERMPSAQLRFVRLVYRLDVNEYRGQRQLQLMIEHFEAL